ncbi:DNA/RNA non-specific endonuclease [Thermodesulfobacteriota bacterium]
MKKLTLFIFILLIFSLLTATSYADCRGCCSRHGGVDCIDGATKCRDGSPLSQKCLAKDCNKCRAVSSTPASVPTKPKSVTVSAPPSSPGSFRCNGHVAYGIPGPEDQLLCREGYAVGYDYDRKVPAWVAYHLTPDSVNPKFKRSNKFKEDTEIPAQYRSTLSDYKGSGYDRGHMAASATVDFSYKSMMESFLLSNMTPQLPGLNRQGWRYLEQHIREWTNDRGKLYVVTGAMFVGSNSIIGNGVHVPTHFYKVVYDSVSQDAIAFLVPHRAISKGDLPAFIVSVDEVERLTGLDFNNLLGYG